MKIVVFLLTLLASNLANAATLQSYDLSKEKGEDVVSFNFDSDFNYETYRLSNPQRVIFRIPSSDMVGDIIASKGGSYSLEKVVVTPMSNGVNLEVSIKNGSKAIVTREGNSIIVRTQTMIPKFSRASKDTIIDGISIVKMKKGLVKIIFSGVDMKSSDNIDVTEFPGGLYIDLNKMKSAIGYTYKRFENQRVKSIRVEKDNGNLRFKVTLNTEHGFQHKITPTIGGFELLIGADEQEKMIKNPEDIIVESINVEGDGDHFKLKVIMERPNSFIRLYKSNNDTVFLDILGGVLNSKTTNMHKDTRGLGSPVSGIESFNVSDVGARISMSMSEDSDISSYQSGKLTIVEFVPKRLNGTINKDYSYSGKKVNFDFKDVDIRDVLLMLSKMVDINLIMANDIKGALTMRLIGVPWDQALDLILSSKGLGKEFSGNVLKVATMKTLKDNSSARKEARVTSEEAAPLVTEFVHLGYASVKEIDDILKKSSGGKGKGGGLALLSNRGSVLLDKRGNTLIITDTRERIENIKYLVKMVDKPVDQVLIEARIVEASNDFSRDLGIKWGGLYNGSIGASNTNQVNGGGLNNNVVDLGAAVGAGAGGAIGYTLSALNGVYNVSLELSAAEAAGEVKVVSSPRILASNMNEAVIEQTQDIPFPQTTFAGGVATTSTISKLARLTLRVTPQITADGSIILSLEVNKDTPRVNNLIPNGDPIIDKKNISTRLLVKDGNTIVLGGIYTETKSNNVNGVPFLSDIPVLGNLFKRKQKTNNRSELLIFITPHIVSHRHMGDRYKPFNVPPSKIESSYMNEMGFSDESDKYLNGTSN